jgi:hypothetical protein
MSAHRRIGHRLSSNAGKKQKNAGTSIEVARELRSVPVACEPAGAQYGAVHGARKSYFWELSGDEFARFERAMDETLRLEKTIG